MIKDKKNIFIISGESSGDMHAGSLIKELKILDNNILFKGIGGNEMKLNGADILYDIKEVNFIGFSSVIKNYGKIKNIFDECVKYVKENVPEAIILIDYPGFNLRFIKAVRKFYAGKIIYYISPQLWAWYKSRVETIKQFTDLMLVVFPFEVDFYKKEGVTAEFVGHPLVKRINLFLASNKKEPTLKKVISILPGSRKDEIERMMPVLVRTAKLFKKHFDCEINFICSANLSKSYLESFINSDDFNIIFNEEGKHSNYKAILNSDIVITKSGTSTVECALLGVPFCVVYKAGKVNYLIGKNLIKVKFIAMINILLGRESVKEFLQNKMIPEKIFNEGKRILTEKKYTDRMKSDFNEIRKILTDKDASANAAMSIIKLLNEASES